MTGPKLAGFLHGLHEAENELFDQLLRLADDHKADAEVFHVARDLTHWCERHIRELAEAGRAHGLDLDPEPSRRSSLVGAARQRGAGALSHLRSPGLLLLQHLRQLHGYAAEVLVDWHMLEQVAKAAHADDLVALAKRSAEETKRQAVWAERKCVEAAPQALVTD